MKAFLKQITTIQWLTILLITSYLLWEFVFLNSWKQNTEGPLIRADLIIIYPLIAIGLIISFIQLQKRLYQFPKNKSRAKRSHEKQI